MNPTTPLKLSAVAFAVLWTIWMVWWSGAFDRANIVILTICGIAGGYAWYRVMRWYFRRRGMLPPDQRPVDAAMSIRWWQR